MKSPAAEWTLGIAYLGTLDYLRARGEADDDTLSEVIRGLVKRHPLGHHALAAALAVGSLAFYRHIVEPLKEQSCPP